MFMSSSHENDSAPLTWLDIVRQKVGSMRFGSVQIVVHEGRVTQVESTEKTRLAEPVATVPATLSKKK